MKHFLKYLFFFSPVFFVTTVLHAQYGNEWINYSNTYYKFKVGKDGIYRIGKAQLADIGMAAVEGSKFAIFREGAEIPVYVSTDGIFSDNDFIEFYGRGADGKMDTELYTDPSYQPTDKYGILSDTAFYFITYADGVHQRIVNDNNDIPTIPPTPEPFFWFTGTPATLPLAFVSGKSYSSSDEYQSSEFDQGEGYVHSVRPAGGATYTLGIPTVRYYSAPTVNAKLTFSLVGNSLVSTHNTQVGVNGTILWDTTYGKYDVVKKTIYFPSTSITTYSTGVSFTDPARYGVTGISIEFPRLCNMAGTAAIEFPFSIKASTANPYFSFINVASSNNEYLYDIVGKKRYLGVKAGSSLRFYLPPSSYDRPFYLADSSLIRSIETFIPVTFKDYTATANQGNYIILTNNFYINATPSFVNDYKNYRNSPGGGSYTTTIISVDDLYNQFGYGVEYHPAAIKRFLKYAYENWGTKPEYLMIIGKGIQYYRYRSYIANPAGFDFGPPIPTWGDPGADNIFVDFNNDATPELAIGRLSAWNNNEIGNYLEKVKLYEQAIKPVSNPTLENTWWKKKALHIAGGRDIGLQSTLLLPTLASCAEIFTDTLTGGVVTTIAKNTTDPTGEVSNSSIDSSINNGIGHITFFGHASATTFDYNLNNPDGYNSKPRFPIFYAFGCDVSQIYSLNKTIGENYLNSVNGGSIAMLASDNLSYVYVLRDYYMKGLYQQFSYKNYGKTLGKQYQANLASISSTSVSVNIHKQSIFIQGDPALTNYNPEQADYYTEDAALSANPTAITTAIDTFDLKAIVYNLAKATDDSVLVTLEHTKSGSATVLFTDSVKIPVLNTDTIYFRVPVSRNTDVGLNNYTIKLNADNKYDEMSFLNNQATIQLFIADNSLVPIYPKEFAIVHQQGVTLKASALNLFSGSANYIMELDTTANFDSPFKQTHNATSNAGLIKWTPPVTLKDSTVYYWRTTIDQLIGGQYQWGTSSFVYLEHGSDGWNQSHYYQYKRDEPYYGIQLPAGPKKFKFAPYINTIQVNNRVYYNAIGDVSNIRVMVNDVNLGSTGCNLTGTIQISVFDSITGKPWANPPGGIAGSMPQCDGKNMYQFEFPYATPEGRNNAAKFLDSIPVNNYIVIKNYTNVGPPNNWCRKVVTDWITDTDIYGAGNTLYDKLKGLGFSLIDSFTTNRTFIFIRKKGVENATYPIVQKISADSLDIIRQTYLFESFPDTGIVRSTIIGPAQRWDTLRWRTSAMEAADSPFVKIYGLNAALEETLLYSGASRDTSLAFISAITYPMLRMEWNSVDNINRTSSNLDYWRILYRPVPEAALNPTAYFSFKDSLAEGETGKLRLAIENLTPIPMDSMLVRYKLIDANNVTHTFAEKRYRNLPGNDTLIASLDFDATAYKGRNTLFIEANPDKDQPEEYHPNNLGYLPFHLEGDSLNPLLDVTFDGVHILDKDIVSAKPFIKALLRDENRFSALNDTSMMAVSLVYPGAATSVNFPFDGTICKFIPADLSDSRKNESRIEFKPGLDQDGVYKLIVSGKDKAGNLAGKVPTYEINFTVENKPTITNLLNYPNPFSTATAFLFTLTGSEIPSQFKIQILTVTGKIVREIRKDELGPLHIGRNITEYKWDGKDEYGQMLGNGVYLYRVITSIRGNDVEHRSNTSVDKYFKNGFGKMYIMR